MKWRNLNLLTLIFALAVTVGNAKERGDLKKSKNKKSKALVENCSPATAQIDLNINNVRARILGSGDMWWDLNDAQYEVPKGSNKHSMFAGALWLGGLDQAEQLKLAAMSYRQQGVDYWPGPLTDDGSASVTEETCNLYDRHWMVFRDEVETHASWIECKEDPTCDVAERFPGYEGNIPQSIIDWPGNGINGELPTMLAPFIESDTNGIPGFYEPEWDYPAYDLAREFDCQDKQTDILYGDQTIWWVYNDKGNVHTETQADALGFEIRAQAFAFTSNDEVNNMTFNNYRILNKSTFTLSDTYFGTWFDADLGNPTDDIIGCDISRGLGYVYNGDPDDDGALGYGTNPPAVGLDFFQGPFADFFNGLDDDRDGCIDGVRDEDGNCVSESIENDINERIIMSGFMYYNNPGSFSGPAVMTDPDNAQEYYNYLRSLWKNGSPLIVETPSGKGNTSNGDGFRQDPTGFVQTKFAYPGLSYDTTGNNAPTAPSDWWESPGNLADKRGLHTAGPFTLTPGALNFITTGAVWARNFQGGNDLFASVNDVIVADDKAQALFDNCFEILDGPDSPVMEIVEMDQQLIFNIKEFYTVNTAFYEQEDPLIVAPDSLTPQERKELREDGFFSYRFEGLQVFQVANANVSIGQIRDSEQSRLIFQTDLRNDVDQLVNYAEDESLPGLPLVPTDMTIEANNQGMDLSFTLTEDVFDGGNKLVNHKEYYFFILAYAQNEWKVFDPRKANQGGQKEPYLAGRRIGNDQRPYIGIPHQTESEDDGLKLNAEYNDLMPITRLAGAGNGGLNLAITEETEDAILANGFNSEIDYQKGRGPVKIFVADPKSMVSSEYELRFSEAGNSFRWTLKDLVEDTIVGESISDIEFIGEQIFDEIGLGVSVLDQVAPGVQSEVNNNGLIGGFIEYVDGTKPWLAGVPDGDNEDPLNWIHAGGINSGSSPTSNSEYYDVTKTDPSNPQNFVPLDPLEAYESILGGTWTPVQFASNVDPNLSAGFPVKAGNHNDMIPIRDVPNVDVVFTKDHTKWTRVPVIEMGNVQINNDGQKPQFTLRSGQTLNKDAEGNLFEDPNSTGWSYFPGYAINVETGRRLNMAFGENSWLKSENGADMLWNPSPNIVQRNGISGLAMGGMHSLYVFADSIKVGFQQFEDATYAGDRIEDNPLEKAGFIEQFNTSNGTLSNRNFFGNMYWCHLGMVSSPLYEFKNYSEIPTKARVQLRVQSPYQATKADQPNGGLPLYRFSTAGFAPEKQDLTTAQRALDNIRVVPNPYFGSSMYENSQLESVVKIINLPSRANITIMMSNGSVVRNISKDNTNTFVEWDLTNNFNVPIASGVYIIHIEAPGIGEKVVKWMGTLRPTDLNAF